MFTLPKKKGKQTEAWNEMSLTARRMKCCKQLKVQFNTRERLVVFFTKTSSV